MIIAPVMPPTPPEQPKVTRFHKHGFYMVCDLCGLTSEWCPGHALPEFGSEPTSDLDKRVREAQNRL
jgi:hypothetical protein